MQSASCASLWIRRDEKIQLSVLGRHGSLTVWSLSNNHQTSRNTSSWISCIIGPHQADIGNFTANEHEIQSTGHGRSQRSHQDRQPSAGSRLPRDIEERSQPNRASTFPHKRCGVCHYTTNLYVLIIFRHSIPFAIPRCSCEVTSYWLLHGSEWTTVESLQHVYWNPITLHHVITTELSYCFCCNSQEEGSECNLPRRNKWDRNILQGVRRIIHCRVQVYCIGLSWWSENTNTHADMSKCSGCICKNYARLTQPHPE